MRAARRAGEQVETGGEDVAGTSSSLVLVFGTHGLDETRFSFRVVPEQAVRHVVVVAVENQEIEVGPIERGLQEPRRDVGSAPVEHVMRTPHRVEAAGQAIARVQRADLRSRVGSQPGLDQELPKTEDRPDALLAFHSF